MLIYGNNKSTKIFFPWYKMFSQCEVNFSIIMYMGQYEIEYILYMLK